MIFVSEIDRLFLCAEENLAQNNLQLIEDESQEIGRSKYNYFSKICEGKSNKNYLFKYYRQT